LVEPVHALRQHLMSVESSRAQSPLHSQIAATDRQIDALVYELYGLSAEEIRIVEGEA